MVVMGGCAGTPLQGLTGPSQGQGGSATSSESDSSRPMRGAAPIVGDEGGLEQLAKGGGSSDVG